MTFSLRNILIVVCFLAFWLGLILSKGDQKIRAQAKQLQQDLELIEKSKSFLGPITEEELQRSNRTKLTMN